LRKAGASPVMLSTPLCRAVITQHDRAQERSLAEELPYFDVAGVDLILVEGFKREPFAKIELHRPALGKPLLYPDDPSIIAIASDGSLPDTLGIPRFDINAPAAIADFILAFLGRHGNA
jgi:molybdopterin-guanine dinucleotide biosynthesis protein B